MTATEHPTNPDGDLVGARDPAVARRQLMRGGAVLAGVAGLTVAGALATPAEAADGDNLVLGEENESSSATSVQIGAGDGSDQPTLRLINEGGPSLALDPVPGDWDGDLQPGEIATTARGPLIGIEQDGNPLTTPLLTEQDVWLPFVLDNPMRLVDTRTELGRVRITQPSPLDDEGRLPGGRSLTFWIAPAQAGFGIPGVYLNLTVVAPASGGYAVVYPGPVRPPTSTVNFRAGQTSANGSFIGTSTGTYAVLFELGGQPQLVEAQVINVFTTTPVWIVVDATAAFATGEIPDLDGDDARQRIGRSTSPVAKARKGFGRMR